MTITVKQTTDQVSELKWNWSVWLEGEEAELDEIESVTYQLHETFKNPIVHITDRQSNFRLNSSGWGQFVVYLAVVHSSGETTHMEHWLEFNSAALSRGGQPEETGSGETQRAFLSYSLIDTLAAKLVREKLEATGVAVFDMKSFKPGEDVQMATERMLEQSDFAVSVVSETSKQGSWDDFEFGKIKDNNLPFIQVLTNMDDQPTDIKVIAETADRDDAKLTGLANMVAQKLNLKL